MIWEFHLLEQGSQPVLQIRWTSPSNLPARLTDFRQSASSRETHDIYARAAFLKYQALVDDFAIVASNEEEWMASRAKGEECFAVLEASIPQSNETAGTLLLRSAWNRDAVIDLLGTNSHTSTRVHGAGIMLVMIACEIAKDSQAQLIFAETARHSTSYWLKFLKQGTEFIRFDGAEIAFGRAQAIVSAGNLTHARAHDKR